LVYDYHTNNKARGTDMLKLEIDSVEESEEWLTLWVNLDGVEFGTKFEFTNDSYGICSNGSVYDADNYPLTESDVEVVAVRNAVRNLADGNATFVPHATDGQLTDNSHGQENATRH
jgi:hypothetical protein